MGYYKVLSAPMSTCMPYYKGLYRSEPFPKSDEENRFMALWQHYVQHSEKNRGITIELTIDELKELASLATKASSDSYEVIYFSDSLECPHQSEYYGVDVAGYGGYSMVGENFFKDSIKNGIYYMYDVINHYFRAKLNSYGLFNRLEDAISFRMVLNDLTALSSSSIEQEDRYIVHIYKII